jgi:hypothetical protein
MPFLRRFSASFAGDFVLRRARESAIRFGGPQRVVFELDVRGHEDGFLELLRVLADASTLHVLLLHDPGQLLAVNAIRIIDDAV